MEKAAAITLNAAPCHYNNCLLGQVRNVTLMIVITALMAFGIVGMTMLVDLLPIPAMHAATAKAVAEVALKSSLLN